MPDLGLWLEAEGDGTGDGELRRADERNRSPVDNAILLACGLAWLGALIHIQAAVDHSDESTLYTVLFAGLAASQLLWGAAAYRTPSRGLLWAGALGSLAVIAVWLWSRTAGLPVGPDPGAAEPAGVLDGIATADELVLIALVTLQLLAPVRRAVAWLRSVLCAGALMLIVVSSLALAGGLHAH